MSSVVTTSDSPTFRKNMSVDNDDIKEELNYLTKEVDALNTILVQKDKEIDHWRSKVHDESELKDIVSDLQAKLQQALGETKELKEAQAAKQNQLQSKYIEKTQHNKEIVELKAKINYLTSENERLNKIISSKFDSWQNQGDNGAGSRLGEEEKSELVGKLESYSKENERLEKLVQENAIEILEWKTKSAELEAENHKLKAEVKEQEEEVEILKKANEEKDKQIVEFKTKKDRLTQSQEENEKLVKSLEAKKKEIEEIKAKYAGVEKKEAELALLKERYQMTVKENENLHVVIVGKDMEIEELKLRCEEFDRNVELIKEQESMINKLNIEKDELMIRYNGRNEALKKEKEINQNLTTECNELQANLRFVEQQNMELMQVTEGYERMIEDLKNTVVKGEKGTYRMLNFDPDSLA